MIRAAILSLCVVLTGCATAPAYEPIVDRPGPNYATDLAECKALGAQAKPVSSVGVFGAVAGAAVTGQPIRTTDYLGSMQGRYVVMMCLTGRGYRVLG